MKPKSSFATVFGDAPINRLWEFLVDSRGLFDYSMTDICEASDISWNTLKEIFPSFVKDGVVKKTRRIGRATMYILNETHPKVAFMIGIHKAINMVFVRGGHFKIKMKIIKGKTSKPIEFDIPHSAVKSISIKN